LGIVHLRQHLVRRILKPSGLVPHIAGLGETLAGRREILLVQGFLARLVSGLGIGCLLSSLAIGFGLGFLRLGIRLGFFGGIGGGFGVRFSLGLVIHDRGGRRYRRGGRGGCGLLRFLDLPQQLRRAVLEPAGLISHVLRLGQ